MLTPHLRSAAEQHLYSHVASSSAHLNHRMTATHTMAAILDDSVFTKLVCPLPRRLTFSSVLPAVPWEKRGLMAAMAMKRGVRLEGDWKLTVVMET